VLAKKGHTGMGASTIRGASLQVSPEIVAPGGRVRVSGKTPRCRLGDKVIVLSRAFRGRAFAGLGALTTRIRRHGAFTAAGSIRRNARAGTYSISARCDGRSLGIVIRLRVMPS
jgi:hypothetical protein